LQVARALEQIAPLRGVYGNIDGLEIRRLYPEHLRFQVEGISVWMTHIGGQPKKYPKEIRRQLESDPPDLFLCGHSHIVRAERDRFGVFHINPGACGQQGFHLVKTAMTLELASRKVTALRILEFGPRGG
jgi:putative phosphoesterase